MSKPNKSTYSSKYSGYDPEAATGISRKRSLVRPERAKIDSNHPNFYYNQVANREAGHINIQKSTTGANPILGSIQEVRGSPSKKSYDTSRKSYTDGQSFAEDGIPLEDMNSNLDGDDETLRRKNGKELYGLNDEVDGLGYQDDDERVNEISRLNPMGYRGSENYYTETKKIKVEAGEKSSFYRVWLFYCSVVSFWAPAPLLKLFGMPKKEQQTAWREKIGLVTIIFCLGAIVAFLVFGFTRTVCKASPTKIRNNEVGTGYLIINGQAYDLTTSLHPAAEGIPAGTNVLYSPVNAGGLDGSFLFQNVNGNCKGLITPRDNCTIPKSGEEVAWYMPCKMFSQDGSTKVNFTEEYYDGYACHTSDLARSSYYSLKAGGDVYFSWDDIKNSSRKLVVYNGDVLDLSLIDWIQYTDLEYPEVFDKLKDDENLHGKDISIMLASSEGKRHGRCLQEIIKVGTIDSDSIGCIASDIVLYSLLTFILSIIFAKFFVACYFRWIVSPKQGASVEDFKTMNKRLDEIEDWSENIYSQGPIKEVPQKQRANYSKRASRTSFLGGKRHSRMSSFGDFDMFKDQQNEDSEMTSMALQKTKSRDLMTRSESQDDLRSSFYANSRLAQSKKSLQNPFVSTKFEDNQNLNSLSADLIHPKVVSQPPVTYQPFGYPLAHTICLVTCYSEDEAGMRTTLDSLATTDYPNSHKLLFVICDGLIKGSGNDRYTSDIAIDMMTDLVISEEEIEAYSYVAVAQGSKRHNKAKVFAGYYKYDDDTVPSEKQQRIPMICVVKCGTEAEQGAAKPGNRGKRDSQIILMSFLQKVTFNERMSRLDYEILTNIWSLTGLMAEMYEIVLMVDADTKVYPDSLTHMVATMVQDNEVMGLCGETKISNKSSSFTTAIQVFEYFISHHQAKAFESVFGCVTCLPGCFCMYRIKAPKGKDGYWVPILANPDIVERYSDNVVDTLHKKNLLLLGEDRFLSTLMLRTFPKRKQVFIAKAACKTIVPDKFKVLLSQRRRWINSTVHNLMELVLVKDLCGTFCFSMQFVIFIELIGTLVLPAAIVFTIYVIIYACIEKPTPVLTLTLLAVVFGLPALLIVATVSRLSYILWMLIYLVGLPIWNFVLPTYAYWKFDDFSWGDTRKVAGDKGHEDEEGDFDATHIVMRRWREFEIERIKSFNLSVPGEAWNPMNDSKADGSLVDLASDEPGNLLAVTNEDHDR
ncbi:chitin synthase [Saccharomycopsis crataegensis]|uniref:chitin synthase n=1 Tax=Saccharomycopsis crataegensis TaxID=43959 RepID=A0AAV5QLF5_9ASCO|nr:chitin synthase [Saccharomycopsis crataegensis]